SAFFAPHLAGFAISHRPGVPICTTFVSQPSISSSTTSLRNPWDLGSLSFSFTRAELLHRIALISDEPFLHNLAIAQAKDGESFNRHLLARGSKAKEGSLVGATLRHPDHYLVSFSNQILNGGVPIREGSKQKHHPLLIALPSRRSSRKGVMVDRIGGKY